MALWLENLPRKHEVQSSDPHSPQKRPHIHHSRFQSQRQGLQSKASGKTNHLSPLGLIERPASISQCIR